MNNWQKRIDKLIDMTGTLEHRTWLNNELKQLKTEIQDELRTRK